MRSTFLPPVALRCALLATVLASPCAMRAQSGPAAPQVEQPLALLAATADLPDAPGSLAVKSGAASSSLAGGDIFQSAGQRQGGVAPQIAPKYKRTVQPDQAAVPLTARDKLVLSVRLRASPIGFASTLFSAGYAHLADSRPHFGTDKAGFGERLGGAELRQTVQSLLTYGVYASAFHDDPRYYVLGRKEGMTKRAIYAAERVVITRKDDGRPAINWPQLAGIASGQAFANSYYPSRDQSVSKTVTGTISSYGTSALVNELNEFLGDVIGHFRHKPQP